MAICRLMRVKVRTRQQRLDDKNENEDLQLRTQNNHNIEYLPSIDTCRQRSKIRRFELILPHVTDSAVAIIYR